MPITIGSNIASLKTQRQLSKVSDSLATASERLASGLRINSAADDAAGLSISTSLVAKTRTLQRALLNANDGVSMLSIADSALGELTTITTRLQELAESAANGPYNAKQREALDKEAGQLTAEYNRIIETTSFNGIKVLHGEVSTTLMVGTTSESMLTVDFAKKLMRPIGNGQFTLGTQVMPNNFSTPVVGDFNGDGKSDLVTNSGLVFFGNGDGTLGAPFDYDLLGRDKVVGDFNGDGFDDIAQTWGFSSSLEVILSNGNGTMKAPRSFDYYAGSGPMATADVNGDGKVDIVSVHVDGGGQAYISTFLGNGDGTFQARISYLTGGSSTTVNSLCVFDANGDGILDILNTTAAPMGYLALGNGDGTFKAPTSFGIEAYVSYGDINNDGKIDLVGATGLVYFGNGNGTFSVSTTRLQGVGGHVAAPTTGLKDYNGDGNLDVLFDPQLGLGDIRLWLGNGDGTFSPQATQSGFYPITDTGDFNGDGVLDLVSVDSGTTQVAMQGAQAGNGISPVNLTTVASARSAMSAIAKISDKVLAARSELGATQSRLQTAISHLQSVVLTYQDANSRIMDADIATEVAEYQRLRIQREAATAVLAQANLSPQIALKLLKGS